MFKLAIHNGPAWNAKWIQLCQEKKINHIIVDCYDPNIIDILKKEAITHLMWGFHNSLPQDLIVARSVLNSARAMGIKTFPDYSDGWHFEDKVAQKYLLEAVGAPVVKSWAFFDKKKALQFIDNDNLPIVAKLRKGAGSYNVVLLRSRHSAKKYIRKMFGKGLTPSLVMKQVSDKFKAIATRRKTNVNIPHLINNFRNEIRKKHLFPKEVGYVYFQEFLPNNKNDLRIVVVGNRAWGFYRGVRPNDFRASGSGLIDYETSIPIEMIETSFNVANKLKTHSICFDYVKSPNGQYQIVEICYGYVGEAIYKCNGYWDYNLNFHKGHFWPEECVLNDFIRQNNW